jgi:hypothetical protein
LLVAVLAIAILGGLASAALIRYGSLTIAIQRLKGEILVVDRPVVAMSGVRPGSRVDLRYSITNVADHPVRLLGASTSCSCTMVENLPIVLAPSETRTLSATVSTSEDDRGLDGSIHLYMDDTLSPEIIIGYKVRFEVPTSPMVSQETP